MTWVGSGIGIGFGLERERERERERESHGECVEMYDETLHYCPSTEIHICCQAERCK